MAPAYSMAAVMGLVVAAAGLGAPLALVVSTIPIAFIACGFMLLSARYPSAGAVYSWSRLAFGARTGWFSAMLIIIAYYFGTIATAFPAGVYTLYTLHFIWPNIPVGPFAIGVAGVLWIAFSTYFLIIGARPTAKLSAFFLAFELISILLLAGLAFAHPYSGTPHAHAMPLGLGLGVTGASGLIVGAVLSIWITAGWEISTYSSEETSKGGSTPGAGAIIGLLGTAFIVFICMVAFMRVGTVAGFTQHQDDALAYVADRLGGGWTSWLMVATVLVSSAASLWTTMFTLARGVFAMGRDRVLPNTLGAVHPRFGSPANAILLVSIPVIAIMLVAGVVTSAQNELQTVVSGSSIFLGATFIITGLACAWMQLRARGSEPRHPIFGLALPLLGALLTLAFLIYNVATQQPKLVQEFSVAGVILALLFAVLAGRWSPRFTPAIPAEEEA